jgi:hypothetical protein
VDDSVNSITATDIYLDDAAIETYMHWNSLIRTVLVKTGERDFTPVQNLKEH